MHLWVATGSGLRACIWLVVRRAFELAVTIACPVLLWLFFADAQARDLTYRLQDHCALRYARIRLLLPARNFALRLPTGCEHCIQREAVNNACNSSIKKAATRSSRAPQINQSDDNGRRKRPPAPLRRRELRARSAARRPQTSSQTHPRRRREHGGSAPRRHRADIASMACIA